jgi:hypothetical protein
MEVLLSSKMSVHTRSTRRHISEDGILHSHRCENLKSYTRLAIEGTGVMGWGGADRLKYKDIVVACEVCNCVKASYLYSLSVNTAPSECCILIIYHYEKLFHQPLRHITTY